MFRPCFNRINTPQRIPPFPSDPVYEDVKIKTLNGNSSVVESEIFNLDPGIYEITVTTPLKSNVNRIIDGDSIERASTLGRIKQYQYNVLPTKCYAHYCNDYIEMTDSNSNHSHLEPKSSYNQTGNIYSGYGEYYIVRSKCKIDSKQPTNINPPTMLRLPSISGLVSSTVYIIGGNTTAQTTGWHILAGYNANTIPIDLQKNYYSTSEVVQV